ncbi:MAG: hypothetical protein CL484_12090 [Acidobacteria bacterium]|nr:hypothetical protein [Acidobacteriota bacterium]|tara:strand:- start:1344 stop:1994 length:651 start_codon:yes stop_codon:yes gene_type:complete
MNSLQATAIVDALKALTGYSSHFSADSGTTQTLVDAELTQADDYWNNAQIVFVTGPNAGISRTILDFTASSDTLAFNALPNAVTAGNVYFLLPKPDVYYSSTKVFPIAANSKQFTANAAAWNTTGSYVEVVANVGANVELTGFYCSAISASDHQIYFATGGAGAEAIKGEFPCSAVGFIPLSSVRIANGTRLAAKTSSASTNADTINGFFTYKQVI